jgi:hypothetical protein
MALEGTTNKVYAALNLLIVKTKDGVDHTFHYTKDLVLHGGKGPGVDTFVGLEEGTTILVHYTVTNDQETALEVDRVGDKGGLQKTEGVVADIDRRHKRITIKYANGLEEVMQLTPTAAAALQEADEVTNSRGATKIVVYYTDEAGLKVAHYFRKTS